MKLDSTPGQGHGRETSMCVKKTHKRLQDTGGHKRGTGMERRVAERSYSIKFCMKNRTIKPFVYANKC